MLQPGDRIPDFTLETGSGDTVSSAGLRGKRFVLYFYPKDDTPGCTKEACGFRDNLPRFGALGVPVFGISADSTAAHDRFARKYGLGFPLLSDPDRRTIEGFGTWIEKQLYGRRYMGIARATFVVGPDGRVEKVWEKVTPATHADEVLGHLTGSTELATRPPEAKRAASPAAKPAAKKTAPKKSASKKTVSKQTALKKTTLRKTAAKTAATRTTAAKRPAPKRAAAGAARRGAR
ncbi:MAG TPA: peroxiredoxin [Xanthomonadales bacterium]|nr:peroxiredoxin [Xanthomonadales bacterium]